MFQNKNTHKRLAMTLGGIIGAISIGTIITIATLDTTQEIPDSEVGTIGYALRQIINGDWQNSSLVKQSKQLGGVNGEQFLRMTSTYGCLNNNEVLRRISPDGHQIGSDCVALPALAKRPRPILATIRDLDSNCFGGGLKRNNPGYSSGGTSIPSSNDSFLDSNVVDLYENDTLTTTGSCTLASLYMPDNSIIRMGPNASITLRYAGIAGGSGATSTDLDQGELWARVLKPATDDSYFNVNTQEASVGVRGTSVYIKRDKVAGKTTALPIDSGRVSGTAGAIVVYPANKNLNSLGVPLTQQAIVDSGSISKSSYTGASEFNVAPIYSSNEFIRKSTLVDIKDFNENQKNVGNLATLKTFRSEFSTHGGKDSKYSQSDVASMNDKMPINGTINLEINNTLPSSPERTALCGGSTSGEKWWKNVPIGYQNCIEKQKLFLADYSKNDRSLYGAGLSSEIGNNGFGNIINGGILINVNNQYISYTLNDVSREQLKKKVLRLKLSTAVPDPVLGGGDRYIIDFGGDIKVSKDATTWYCGWTDTGECGEFVSWDDITKEIQITLPDEKPTQLIFGNQGNDGVGNLYTKPIGTTIQSINISPPTSS